MSVAFMTWTINFIGEKMNYKMKLMIFLLLMVYNEHSFSETVVKNFSGKRLQDRPLQVDYSQSKTIKMGKFSVTLTNLNSYINKWFLLAIQGKDYEYNLHLENRINSNKIELTHKGLKFTSKKNLAQFSECSLWSKKGTFFAKLDFENHTHTFYQLCDGLVYIRLVKPSNTLLSLTEVTTSFLRKTAIGEGIINFFKPTLVGLEAESDPGIKQLAKPSHTREKELPLPVQMRNLGSYNMISKENQLGIELESKTPINFGHWNETKMHPGVYVSMFKPDLIDKKIFEQHKSLVYEIKPKELDKLVYIIAYDLDKYSINYAVGTKHPAINQNHKIMGAQADYNKYLVPIGSIPPYEIQDAIGVFIGGFKNKHGRFKHGPLKGRTYGYIQNGVELEPMSPGLATVYLDLEGHVEIAKWPENREEQIKLRKRVVAARQNGAMLIEDKIPGSHVKSWRNGNWSGSANGLGQSLRSGICMQQREDRRYLLFMAFYSATPSTMARTMQAYSCTQGMHLDMNAHMYLHNALYTVDEADGFKVEYLNQEMLYPKGSKKHRFIMDNNPRDFFYIKRRPKDVSLIVTN